MQPGWRRSLLILVGLAVAAVLWLQRAPCPSAPTDESARDESLGESQRLASVELSEEQRRRIEMLEAIGYVAGEEEAPDMSGGVTVHRETRAYPGVVLYVSGHAPVAILMDVRGNELHRWQTSVRDAWPGLQVGAGQDPRYFRRAYLYDNGDLLVIFEGTEILKLDRDSNLLWANANRAHHAAYVMPDGTLYVLTREARLIPEVRPEQPVLEDFVVELSHDGQERRRVSVLYALLGSEHRSIATTPDSRLNRRRRQAFVQGDLHHTNAIHVLDRDHPLVPALRRGHVLLSSPWLSALFAIDMDSKQLVWFLKGGFVSQHEPVPLANGHMLLFDNNVPAHGSRAMIIDPSNGDEIWQYPPAQGGEQIFSGCCSTATRLPNGNTQLVISASGRVIEVTPDHEIVWEFINPHRAGTKIAQIFDAQRMREGFPLDWTRP